MGAALKSAGGAFVKSRGGVRADKYAHYYGRSNMGIAAHEGKMFLFGGEAYSGDSLSDDVNMGDLWYTTDGANWTLRPTICVDLEHGLPSGETITARRNPALVSRLAGLYIFGGNPYSEGWMNGDGIGRVWSPFVNPNASDESSTYWNNASVQFGSSIVAFWVTNSGITMNGSKYSSASPVWQNGSTTFTSPPPPILTAAAYMNGSAYITGGQAAPGDLTYYNNTYVTTDGQSFTRIAGNYTKCSGHVMLSLDSALYIIAWIPSKVKNEVWKSANGATWTKLTDAPEFELRYRFSGCVFDNKLWIMGGRRVSPIRPQPGFSDVWYSSDGVTWTEAVRFAPWGKFA
jgi:hypothetical protein